MRRVLVIMLGDTVTTHPLPESGEVVIGRGQAADVRVDHPSVSRTHVAIDLGSVVRIRDLGSASGTTLRGARLPSARSVEVGGNETFQFGDVAAVLQERRGQPVAPAVLEATMQNLFELARRVAVGTISVLVTGDSGAGKERLAEAIHGASPRAKGPLIKVNCAAIAETLLDSDLFEAAHGGTLFLDEVGELSAAGQATLLRVIEDKRVQRVGAIDSTPVDVRFVAASNRDLEVEAAAGRFRGDLYYRLAGIVLEVPPLRERAGEIEPLARAFAPAAPEVPDGFAERARIIEALDRCAGNQTRAAELLGMPRRTLVKRLAQHEIPRPKK